MALRPKARTHRHVQTRGFYHLTSILHRMPTVQDDLYGFGSTIYSIMTGQYPFQELPSNEVEKLYKAHKFPDVTGIPCREIIERCWRCGFISAQEIYDLIQAEILSCKIAIK